MNTKIKEIIEKCTDSQMTKPWPLVDQEKLAVLVIEECIKIGEKVSKEIFQNSKKPGDIFEYQSHGAADVVDHIKEHFGLE
jgi:hypothetical protein